MTRSTVTLFTAAAACALAAAGCSKKPDMTPAASDTAAFGAMMQEDLARWRRVVAPLNISLD